ncbi:class I SAM-dependent methyltransferase [Alkaliphilus hydrothermalis]|uniref:Ubiquinone/menaquinone biosynthesis C-methylase UbiE n=1 Tax=Alkaliphilus hydrothermalis TaxID=1482730 RepID=A0ABS2NT33_9FIRM|nr:class I SAM-dependent methyltransferase [Alkaliphilus hydrothermalis]MBM7616113.1 ubiquinone/menaquinone biosynthesis C-methylase UbiE [Alkaliphilus hydrothermalis]
MAHKFNIANKERLDNEKRRAALPPYKVLENLGLQEGDICADIGCGIGYFTIPAGEIVGESGKVYGMDISLEMIEELEKKIEEQEILNIKTIITKENDMKVEDDFITYAFICTVLHEADEIQLFLKEVQRILKPKGKIVIVEWKKEEQDWGPPMEHRLQQEEIGQSLQEIGFKDVKYHEVGDYFYGVVAEK